MPPVPESSLAVTPRRTHFVAPSNEVTEKLTPEGQLDLVPGMQTPVLLKRNGETLIPGELDLVLGMQTPVPLKQTKNKL